MRELDSEILRDVGAVARSIQSISDIQFRQLRLQKGQFIFLTRICENPGKNLMELSQLLRVDKTTTTKAIQKLLKAGYIRKTQDENDQRMWRLYPAAKALKSYQQVIAAENNYIRQCFQKFTPQEKKSVCALMVRMRDNIETEWKRLKKTPPIKKKRTAAKIKQEGIE